MKLLVLITIICPILLFSQKKSEVIDSLKQANLSLKQANVTYNNQFNEIDNELKRKKQSNKIYAGLFQKNKTVYNIKSRTENIDSWSKSLVNNNRIETEKLNELKSKTKELGSISKPKITFYYTNSDFISIDTTFITFNSLDLFNDQKLDYWTTLKRIDTQSDQLTIENCYALESFREIKYFDSSNYHNLSFILYNKTTDAYDVLDLSFKVLNNEIISVSAEIPGQGSVLLKKLLN